MSQLPLTPDDCEQFVRDIRCYVEGSYRILLALNFQAYFAIQVRCMLKGQDNITVSDAAIIRVLAHRASEFISDLGILVCNDEAKKYLCTAITEAHR